MFAARYSPDAINKLILQNKELRWSSYIISYVWFSFSQLLRWKRLNIKPTLISPYSVEEVDISQYLGALGNLLKITSSLLLTYNHSPDSHVKYSCVYTFIIHNIHEYSYVCEYVCKCVHKFYTKVYKLLGHFKSHSWGPDFIHQMIIEESFEPKHTFFIPNLILWDETILQNHEIQATWD